VRRAVVTGGAGFIGSHVVDALVGDGYRVLVIDDLSTGDADRVDGAADLEVLDITARGELDRLFERFRPEVVHHLAAQSSVTISVRDPLRDCAVNVAGTLNVLLAADRHRAPVIFTSTGGALYGDCAPIPTPEDRPPAPISPYGASKWAGEAYVATWSLAGGLPHAICRLGNVYGPRQSPDGEAGVVAILIHAILNGQAPVLYGYGTPTRDYIHVTDVARALLLATGHRGTFNIATGIETPVIEIFEALRRLSGSLVEPQLAPLREGELTRSGLDTVRAKRTFSFEPEVELEVGLQSTFSWFAARIGPRGRG
jgi:UDP-glucose 4-epimerase